jgi:transcriptional regulator with XRE-family HTH domain
VKNEKFAKRFRQLTKDIDEKDLAKKLDVTLNTFRQWKNGYTLPTCEKLLTIADYFDVTCDYLLGGSDCKTADNEAIRLKTGLTDEAINTLTSLKDVKYEGGGFVVSDVFKKKGLPIRAWYSQLDLINDLITDIDTTHEISTYMSFLYADLADLITNQTIRGITKNMTIAGCYWKCQNTLTEFIKNTVEQKGGCDNGK